MSARGRAIGEREEAVLYAYHDGELRGLARWRFERRLARSAALRDELALLRRMRELVAEHDTAGPAPDLWDSIALRLPAVDARREAAGAAPARARGLPLLRPLGAVAAVAAVAALAVFSLLPGEAVTQGTVRWIDSGSRNVIVFDDDEEMTIIWVLDGQSEGASTGGGRGFSA